MDHDKLADDGLIAGIATSGDAFDAFYRRHVAGVVRFLAGRCRSPEDVADATASTFLAVLDACSTCRPELGSGASWLYAIAKHGKDVDTVKALLKTRWKAKFDRDLTDPHLSAWAEQFAAGGRVIAQQQMVSGSDI